jgi:hypothetical protein
MKDALTVNFTIPAAVPTGEYLFRVEHIGLHVAQYVLGEHFSSYSGMSQEELLLRHFSGATTPNPFPKEVIANSPLTDRSLGAAQFYISCAQLSVTKGGSGTPSPLVSPFL